MFIWLTRITGPYELLSSICICLHIHLLAFYISIFFPQTTGPIETDVNVTCVILNILYDICYIQNFNMAARPIMFYDCLHWT